METSLLALLPPGPYAIEPLAAAHLMAFLSGVEAAGHVAAWQARAGEGGGQDAEKYGVADGVAQLSLSGPMSKGGAPSLGTGSTVTTRRQVRLAKNDPAVQSVMLVIDSPGGTVDGTADLAEDVRQLAVAKPAFAYIEDCGCSAAYWVASQCNAIYANPNANVGSIGVRGSLVDSSAAAEKAGLRFVYVGTGAFKTAGAMGVPLTPEHEAYFQGLADDQAALFYRAVQRGRGLSDAQMAALKDARVHVGARARGMGLVDGITTLDRALALLKTYRAAPKAA